MLYLYGTRKNSFYFANITILRLGDDRSVVEGLGTSPLRMAHLCFLDCALNEKKVKIIVENVAQ